MKKLTNTTSGIPHIESLSPTDFITIVSNFNNFIISEKLDGNNLVFGLSKDNILYTSRENKKGDRQYNSEDYNNDPHLVGFKNAHRVLSQVYSSLLKILDPGDAVECEILVGRQPNAIVYGNNYIALLRMIKGDNENFPKQEKIKKLTTLFNNIKITIPTISINSDGIDVWTQEQKESWEIVPTQQIDPVMFKRLDINNEIDQFENWLQNLHVTGFTNEELLSLNLTKIPKKDRAYMKFMREEAINQSLDYKMLIKEKILDGVLRQIQPALRTVDVTEYEDFGVEGVVLLNPKSGYQTKIVDKNTFTIINQFNFAIRNELKKTNKGSYQFNATLGLTEDLYNNMLSQISNIIGIPSLNNYNTLKRNLRKYITSQNTLQSTLENIVNDLNHNHLDYFKCELCQVFDSTIANLLSYLTKYKSEWESYYITLNTGQTLKYNNEIHTRTLILFAQLRNEINKMSVDVQSANTLPELIFALYKKQVNSLH